MERQRASGRWGEESNFRVGNQSGTAGGGGIGTDQERVRERSREIYSILGNSGYKSPEAGPN